MSSGLRPLRARQPLRLRQHAIGELLGARAHEPLRELLRGVPDVERILARVALKSARPRDLGGLRAALQRLPALRACTGHIDSPRLDELSADFGEHPDTLALLERALVEQPPLLTRDGGEIERRLAALATEFGHSPKLAAIAFA